MSWILTVYLSAAFCFGIRFTYERASLEQKELFITAGLALLWPLYILGWLFRGVCIVVLDPIICFQRKHNETEGPKPE